MFQSLRIYFTYNISTVTFGAPLGSIGPGLTFIRDYSWLPNRLAPGRNVMIVACATGGTGLFNSGTSSVWYPPGSGGGTGWVNGAGNGAVARINAAVALNPGNKLVGLLWCSGANDANGGVKRIELFNCMGVDAELCSGRAYRRHQFANSCYRTLPKQLQSCHTASMACSRRAPI